MIDLMKKFLAKTGIVPLNELTPEKVARRFIEDSTPFVLIKLNGKIGVIHIDDYIQKIKPEPGRIDHLDHSNYACS